MPFGLLLFKLPSSLLKSDLLLLKERLLLRKMSLLSFKVVAPLFRAGN